MLNTIARSDTSSNTGGPKCVMLKFGTAGTMGQSAKSLLYRSQCFNARP